MREYDAYFARVGYVPKHKRTKLKEENRWCNRMFLIIGAVAVFLVTRFVL